MELSFHELANQYPLASACGLEQAMRDGGYDSRHPIVLFQHDILDGRARYLAAKAAKVNPTFVTFTGAEDEARRFVQQTNEERRHMTRPPKRDHSREHVYFLQEKTGGDIKIGWALNIGRRLAQLQPGNPRRLVVLAAMPGGLQREKALHKQFSHLRRLGEWFAPAPELLNFINTCRTVCGTW